MLGSNPFVAIGVGAVLLVISFLLPGATRDLILRIVGVLAILAGIGMWLTRRAR